MYYPWKCWDATGRKSWQHSNSWVLCGCWPRWAGGNAFRNISAISLQDLCIKGILHSWMYVMGAWWERDGNVKAPNITVKRSIITVKTPNFTVIPNPINLCDFQKKNRKNMPIEWNAISIPTVIFNQLLAQILCTSDDSCISYSVNEVSNCSLSASLPWKVCIPEEDVGCGGKGLRLLGCSQET